MIKRNYEGTTTIQGMGTVEGIKAINVRVGDYRVWNGCTSSEVVKVEASKTGKTVKITTKWFNENARVENGEWIGEWQEDTRTLKAETIVVVKELNPAEEEIEEIQEVTEEKMKAVIEQETTETASGEVLYQKYKGKFYCKAGRIFISCDNSNNHAWVEEFKTKAEAIAWLKGEEVEIEQPKKRLSPYEKWLRTFIDEKGLNLDHEFIIEHNEQTHFMDLAYLVEIIQKAPRHEQEQIKSKIVYIDFKNGDVMDFFKFLATIYIKNNY